MSDNPELRVLRRGRERFDQVMAIAWDNAPGGKATHYRIDPKAGLILLWGKERDSQALPYEMNCAAATEFAWGWLQVVDYPPQPDHDGDNGKAWLVYVEDWGHVADLRYAIVGVAPAWEMYGK